MKSLNSEPKQKGSYSIFFIRDSRASTRQYLWRVMLAQLLTCLMVGLVLPATPAWSSDQGFLTAEKLYRAKEYSQAEQLYAQVESGDANYPVAQLRLGTIYYLTVLLNLPPIERVSRSLLSTGRGTIQPEEVRLGDEICSASASA
jgi:hypothetical protein